MKTKITEITRQMNLSVQRQIDKYKFCPNCGKELETPDNRFPSCDGHGTVVVREGEVIFRLLRTLRTVS